MTRTGALTLIIPTNRTQFLDEALTSALSQEGAVCHVLIVDDGAEPSIQSQYGDRFPMVKFIRHKENRGLPASRNTGVKNARTKYLTFLDCDDILEPDFAREMIVACQKFKTRAVVCLPHFFFSPWFSFKRKTYFFFLNLIKEIFLTVSFWGNAKTLPKDGFFLVQSSCVIFERDLLNRFPSDETYLTAANDWKLMAEILAHEKVGILPQKLSRYRYHHQSQTQSPTKISKWDYYQRLLEEIPDDCKRGVLVSLFRLYNFLGKLFNIK